MIILKVSKGKLLPFLLKLQFYKKHSACNKLTLSPFVSLISNNGLMKVSKKNERNGMEIIADKN